MALTKHQKLAKAMKRFLETFEAHFQKTALIANVLQLHFYETHLIIGRPLMKEKTLAAMMKIHRLAIERFSPAPKLRFAAEHSPLVGCILSTPIYPQSRILVKPANAPSDEKSVIPWGVKTVLPEENLKKLEEAKLESLLYCAAEVEMSAWIDWFEHENKTSSLTNQMLISIKDSQQKNAFYSNIGRSALPFYLQAARNYFKTPKKEPISATLLKNEFAPEEETTIETAYRIVSKTLSEHKKRHFEDFQRFWRDNLIDLMFEGIPWNQQGRYTVLKDHFANSSPTADTPPRWETGNAVDRHTFGSFISYFLDRFINDPIKRQAEGEIALLLWIMIYAARDLEKPATVKTLLRLTTAQVDDRYIPLDGEEIELSCGLADLIKEFKGETALRRQKKLFPHLSIDRLEDHLRRASEAILPPGSVPALAEAFLTFPHPDKNRRINPKSLFHRRKNPPQLLHDPISLNELKRQLTKPSKSRFS